MLYTDFRKQAELNVKKRHKQERKEKILNFFKKDLLESLIFIFGMSIASGVVLCPIIIATIYNWENIIANIIAFSWIGILAIAAVVVLQILILLFLKGAGRNDKD